MTIKVLEKPEGCFPEEITTGDWIDLKTAEDIVLKVPYAKTLRYKTNEEQIERRRDVVFMGVLAKLGVCIEVPKGYECIVVPRSSTYKKFGVLQNNSIGVIDQAYCGDTDEWKMPLISTRNVTIPKGTRIAQFRVQLSQRATFWQKIKWLFSSEVKLKKMKSLSNPQRGGFGSTGN